MEFLQESIEVHCNNLQFLTIQDGIFNSIKLWKNHKIVGNYHYRIRGLGHLKRLRKLITLLYWRLARQEL